MKSSRYIFSILLATMIATVMLTGCKKDKASQADKNIQDAVANVELPHKLNDATTVTAIYYKDKILTFRNETPSDTLAALNVDSMRSITLHKLRTGLFPRNLINNVVAAGASIRYIYVADSDSVMFSFSSEEFK